MNGLLKVGTLFSGIGSPEFALQKLNVNFESNFACEIDDYARLSFLANHKIDKNNFHKDIYSINPNDLPKNTELLVAGFPCQSFSSAGRGEGINDSKGRGILYLEMMRIVENILPNVVLFENVRGITFSKHDELRKDLYRRLEELGYYFDYKILNTSKVTGIPQSRNRWFLVGFRDKEQFDKFQFPKEDKELLDIRNFIDVENKIDDSFYDTEYRFLKNFFINLKDGTDGYISSFTASREYSGFKEYSPTLLAQEYKCPKCIKTKPLAYIKANFITNGFNYLGYKKYIEENLNIRIEEIKLENFDLEIAKNFGFDYEKFKTFYRKITPRECLNLQGFPEDFKRVVSGLQITKQAGNSMTVDIMAKLIEEILKVYKY